MSITQFDTAQMYKNEKDVGEAIQKSGLHRKELFITSKFDTIKNKDEKTAKEDTLKGVDQSLKDLDMDYIDLYLLHTPHHPECRRGRWEGMEEALASKKVRSIGVSNYDIHHLEELFQYCKVKPVINQIEVSPFLQKRELRQFCEKHGIQVEAYSPMTRSKKLGNETVKNIAEKHTPHKMTPAQVLLRWGHQKGMVLIAKSSTEEHMRENLEPFMDPDCELSDAEMAELDKLDEGYYNVFDIKSMP